MLRGAPPLVAEQEDALGSNPGSSKEYEFDSHQGDYQRPREVLVDETA